MARRRALPVSGGLAGFSFSATAVSAIFIFSVSSPLGLSDSASASLGVVVVWAPSAEISMAASSSCRVELSVERRGLGWDSTSASNFASAARRIGYHWAPPPPAPCSQSLPQLPMSHTLALQIRPKIIFYQLS